jgi:hypothetical protein
VSPSVALGRVYQLLDLTFRQVFTAAEGGVRKPLGHDCSIIGDWRDQFEVRFLHVRQALADNDWSENAHFTNSMASPSPELFYVTLLAFAAIMLVSAQMIVEGRIMDQFVKRENIRHYRRLIDEATNDTERQRLRKLLADEEARLSLEAPHKEEQRRG